MKKVRKFIKENYNTNEIRAIAKYGCSAKAPRGLTSYTALSEKFEDWKSEVVEFIHYLKDCGMMITDLEGFDELDILCLEDNNKGVVIWGMVETVCVDMIDDIEEEA
jgi:hypothetical protein